MIFNQLCEQGRFLFLIDRINALLNGFGGGIAIEGRPDEDDEVSATFEDCIITGNDASVGGGVYWINATADFSGCRISGNTAYHGGGIYAVYGHFSITNCDIMRNMAGIFANIPIPDPIENTSGDETNTDPNDTSTDPNDTSTDPNDTSADAQDIGGIAGKGGGINCTSITADISDCYFYGNGATASGGGIFISGSGEETSVIKNCLIVSNSAGRDGGGISANWFAAASVENCTIANNEVTGNGFEVIDPLNNEAVETGFGGGIYTSYHSQLDVLNSIVEATQNGGNLITRPKPMFYYSWD